jgi:hypothetical protein
LEEEDDEEVEVEVEVEQGLEDPLTELSGFNARDILGDTLERLQRDWSTLYPHAPP